MRNSAFHWILLQLVLSFKTHSTTWYMVVLGIPEFIIRQSEIICGLSLWEILDVIAYYITLYNIVWFIRSRELDALINYVRNAVVRSRVRKYWIVQVWPRTHILDNPNKTFDRGYKSETSYIFLLRGTGIFLVLY